MTGNRERLLRRWFSSWIDQDASAIDEVFADHIVYSECYGPEYRGIDQIKRWFSDWNQKGRVLEWTIREIYSCEDKVIACWMFSCDYEGNVDGFDGVTIAEFEEGDRIVTLREFQSKTEHVYPYEDEK